MRARAGGAIPDFTRFSAAVFDLDGTLVHSEPAWQRAKRQVAEAHGLAVSAATLDAFVGRSLADFVAEILGARVGPEARARAAAEIERIAALELSRTARPVPMAAEFARSLHAAGLRLAVCSSSPRHLIGTALRGLGLEAEVGVVVSAADLPRGKPDALPYRATLEGLGLEAAQVCAFEDSLPGARSAVEAGLWTAAIGPDCTGPAFGFCQLQAPSFVALL
jgi:sugar-phosphatase